MRRFLRWMIEPLARYAGIDPELDASVFYGYVGLVYRNGDDELDEISPDSYSGRELVRFEVMPTGYLSNVGQINFRAYDDLPPVAGMALFLDAGETATRISEFIGDETILGIEAGDQILFSPGRIYIRFRGEHLSISILGVS